MIDNPLPLRFVTRDVPGIGGVIKVRPEDFLVEELPLYEPCGEGEHVYLRIQKNGVSHGEMMTCLRKTFGISERQIGFAGMKDKQALTRQTVSLHLYDDPKSIDLGHDGLAVLWADRHTNKLRAGHLRGNRFSIRIRDVDPLKAPVVMKVLRGLEVTGVPNYFGSQRFGIRCDNHLVGAALLRGDEHVLNEARARERMPRLNRNMIRLYLNAFQAAVFNRIVDQRIEAGTLGTIVEGDLAYKHDGGSVFSVTAEELAGDEMTRRATDLEISPSGPIWGKAMTVPAPGSGVAQVELEVLQAAGIDRETLFASRDCPKGARRALRMKLSRVELESGIDEHGPFIRIAFDLPKGSYATVVLREIMKNDS